MRAFQVRYINFKRVADLRQHFLERLSVIVEHYFDRVLVLIESDNLLVFDFIEHNASIWEDSHEVQVLNPDHAGYFGVHVLDLLFPKQHLLHDPSILLVNVSFLPYIHEPPPLQGVEMVVFLAY